MKKLWQKDAVWFAVAWILLYVLAFGNADTLSAQLGMPKLLTVPVGAVLALVLWGFIRRNGLQRYTGLCRVRVRGSQMLWYLPLAAISSVNLWNGLTWNYPPGETVLFVISMGFVGFLEEVIFRGLLFQGLRKNGLALALAVSSLSFGAGHIVNLLMGAPLGETLLQLVYASAIGFCYTAVFCVSGSILPCILSHGVVNATSAFARQPGTGGQILMALVQVALSLSYGFWLLRRRKGSEFPPL